MRTINRSIVSFFGIFDLTCPEEEMWSGDLFFFFFFFFFLGGGGGGGEARARAKNHPHCKTCYPEKHVFKKDISSHKTFSPIIHTLA